jgi:hypothetical protein
MTEVRPPREGERVPRHGVRCPRCHRAAPREDGIPCGLCSPRGCAGLTFTDPDTGITHKAINPCDTYESGRALPLNVGDVLVTCMACIAEPPIPCSAGDEPW